MHALTHPGLVQDGKGPVFHVSREAIAVVEHTMLPDLGALRRLVRATGSGSWTYSRDTQELRLMLEFETPWVNGHGLTVSAPGGMGWVGRTKSLTLDIPAEALADISSRRPQWPSPFGWYRHQALGGYGISVEVHPGKPGTKDFEVTFRYNRAAWTPIRPCRCGASWNGDFYCGVCRPGWEIMFAFDSEGEEDECHI